MSIVRRLPPEILEIIFSMVDVDLRFTLPFVCKEWRDTINGLKERGFYQTEFLVEKPNLFKLARAGENELIDWLGSIGFPTLKHDTINGASSGGHLDLVKRLKNKDCPWCSFTCAHAAGSGHLKVLKWLCEEGCRWDEWACILAAKNGHLEVLKWLREKGCPWDEQVSIRAFEHGHPEVLKWIQENGGLMC